jgi:hypothetical protein
MMQNWRRGAGARPARQPFRAAVQQKAKAAGIKTIDYDRLTLGGSSDYYVSFDNVAVGKLQGEGLVACLDKTGKAKPAVAELNGSPDDNNATLFAQGYNSVLNPLYASGKYTKAGNQSVPMWTRTRPSRSSRVCSPRPAARSTVSLPRMTRWVTRQSPSSSRTARRCR